MLVAHNQLVEQPGFLVFEAGGNGKVFLPDRLLLSNGRTLGKQRLYRCERLHLVLLDDKGASRAEESEAIYCGLSLFGTDWSRLATLRASSSAIPARRSRASAV